MPDLQTLTWLIACNAELTPHSRPILNWQRAGLILRGQTQYWTAAKHANVRYIRDYVRVSGRTSRKRGRVSFFVYLVSSSYQTVP